MRTKKEKYGNLETEIKLNKFDFTQLQGEQVKVTLYNIERITDNTGLVINYNLFFIVEDMDNAIIKYTLYKLNKDNEQIGFKQVTALQLVALNAIQEQTRKLKSGKEIKTGKVLFNPENLYHEIGTSYYAKLYVIDSIINNKQVSWQLLLPENADTSILERIAQQAELSKHTDILDTDNTVSFDRLRDSELSDLTGNGW